MELIKIQKNNTGGIIAKAVEALGRGAVLIFPTDTVYGLLCDAANESAVERIFKIKKRKKTKPIGIFAGDIKAVKKYAEIPREKEKMIKEKWPGPFTFIFLKKSECGLASSVGDKKTIGIRIPDYKLLIDILKKFEKPIAQTSANISGRPATTKIKDALSYFREQKELPDYVFDTGDLSENKPSIVIDLTSGKKKVLRY